jgi:hypothetical protein
MLKERSHLTSPAVTACLDETVSPRHGPGPGMGVVSFTVPIKVRV